MKKTQVLYLGAIDDISLLRYGQISAYDGRLFATLECIEYANLTGPQ